jgi:tripartite ATP-independent transporter DctM subunit
LDPVLLGSLALATVLLLLAIRVPIAFALGFVASLGLFLFYASSTGEEFNAKRGLIPMLSLLSSTPYDFIHNYPLSMIPLFIGLGHVTYHAGITTDFYHALRIWFARVPGGLAMASIIGCGGFSAITGSSVACASAMGRIAVPEMLRYGYHPRLATGAVAVGGTLGSLIPPSILFVIYAIFTEQSVKVLFLAGILPGLLSLIGYLITTAIWVIRKPEVAPQIDIVFDRKEKVLSLGRTWPAVLLFVVVIGGIYWGFFTPTEAAAVSLALAILIGLLRRRLDFSALVISLRETVLQTSMIFLISIGAKLFVVLISLTQVAPALLSWLQSSSVSIQFVLLAIVGLYFVLGMFLDSIGILVLTLPFTVPLIQGYGLDLIWFGVVVIKLLEIGLITPPIGLNVFVIKSVSPESVSLEAIFQGVSWFLILDLVVLVMILLLPELSLLIPKSVS